MNTVWASLKARAQGLQPLIVAWLAVALILPSLFASLPAAEAATPEAQSVCAALGHVADDRGQPQKDMAHHQCPCCLPGLAGLAALPPHDPAKLPFVADHAEALALAEFNLRRLAGRPHLLAPARAPPASLFI